MTGPVGTTSRPSTQKWQSRWDTRICRARELQQEHAGAKAILEFYEAVLIFQAEVARNAQAKFRLGVPLPDQIDTFSRVSAMRSLFATVRAAGTESLILEAQHLQQEGEERWRALLELELNGDRDSLNATEDFFARTCLQPAAENLQLQAPGVANYIGTVCPLCDNLPQLSILRPEGEGASRSLQCSFCLHEWPYRRIACPCCGEEDKEKLPRYTAEECAHVHVEACDTCNRYLKAVDMSKNGLAVPLVDEAALAVLDLWAVEHGYAKMIRNLLGF